MSSSMVSARKGRYWNYYYIVSAIFTLQAIGAFALIDRLVYGEWNAKAGAGDWITQSLNLLMIATSFLLFWSAVRRRQISVGGILALAVVCFLLLSSLWSIDPQTTIRRGVVSLFAILGTVGIVGSLDEDDVMAVLRMTCGLCAAASIVLFVISPSDALMPDIPGLRGIFSHKNVLGQVTAVGVLASLHIMRVRNGRRLSNTFMLFLFIIVAFLSKSSTALLVIFACGAASGIVALFRKGNVARLLGVFSIMFLVPTAAIVVPNPDLLLDIIGKDPTLTGRTEVWSYVVNYIYERSTLGWGYSAFWTPDNPAANEISVAVGWFLAEAHNGLLEMLLEVGIVGTAFFAILWARNVVLALRCINTSAKEWGISSLLWCGAIFQIGITEPVLLDYQVLTIGFFLTGLMCEKALRDKQMRRYPTTLRVIRRVKPTPAAARTSFPGFGCRKTPGYVISQCE